MADTSQDSAAWVRRLAAGEEEIVREFWSRYGANLQRLAQSRMTPGLQQRLGPDDVVQSVCRTFFRRAREGQFELSGADALWRLLCAITFTKVREFARFHYREQRTPMREVPLAGNNSSEDAGGRASAHAPDPTPAEIVQFADEIQRLFAALDEEEQALVHCKLEGLTQVEIAEQLGCSERTVRRLLDRVRARWEKELESSLGDGPPS